MGTNVIERDLMLRQEADDLLWSRGLHALLSQFGTPHVEGSYILQLMTWRDLDIYLVGDQIPISSFFELGGRIAERFSPVKMSHRNECLARTPGLPQGLYWGVYLGDERAGAWKIDIWAVEAGEYERLNAFSRSIAIRLTDETRRRILEIKDACWQDPRYRKEYTSVGIYGAVLDDRVASVLEFSDLLKHGKGFGITRVAD